VIAMRPETKLDALRAIDRETTMGTFARAMWPTRKGPKLHAAAAAILVVMVREGLAAREGRGPRARYSLTEHGREVLARGLPRETGGAAREAHDEDCGCLACVPPLAPERPAWRPSW
jgi:hypothetical protein